ncbi:hypothetical protein [Roseiconus lacunae]|uniref:Type III restriction enzyme C-terminal endonuclease domain-containing protein n=1 Tax=Roseiconus lacunae TaxID=2605694 RepID=A0ABT7PF45_9BACT|nr:hypothetical protein [Roseiconus lacunae]MDM4015120.1 hypothetical protein [Roseiconus lacunae]
MEHRSQANKIRGAIYIYAAQGRPDISDAEILDAVGQPWDQLDKGVIAETVEVVGCDETESEFEWQLANPQRLETPPKPDNQPQPVWFNPFDSIGLDVSKDDESVEISPPHVSSPMLQVGGTRKLYLARETKDTHDRDKRRDTENHKIDCGRAHFRELGVDYEVATNIQEVLTPRTK